MADASPFLSRRIAELRPTAVNAILAEVRALQSQGRDLVSLMRGEPDFPTSPHIVDAAVRGLAAGRTHYPDNRGERALRDAVAQWIFENSRVRYDAGSEILVTSGATFGIYAALAATLNDCDDVLLPDPIYDAYHSPIRLVGGRPRPVRAELRGGRYCLDVAALEAAWTPASKVLLLNTPWNPVGTVFTERELRDIGEFVLRKKLLLISDEIYEVLTYGVARHCSPASLSDDLRSRTVEVNSLSKTFAMTGWRVGYCAGPRALIDAMLLVLQQSSRGPATFVQDAAAAALSGPRTCVEDLRREMTRRRAIVGEELQNVPGVNVLLPEGGFFSLVDVRSLGHSSDEIRRRLLAEHGVVVVHGAAYGPGGEGTLRVSFASGGVGLSRGLTRLREGLVEIAAAR